MYSDNVTQKVAEVAAKIMAEQLKGNQKKIDKNHNNKIDGQDFAILRGEKKANEEVEDLEEGKWNYPKDMTGKATDDDYYLGNQGSKKDQRKEWRKKEKAKAHQALMTGKKVKEEVDLDDDMALTEAEQLFLESSPQEVLSTIQRIRKDIPKNAKEAHQHLDKAEEHFKSGNKLKGLFHAAKFFLAARKHSMKEEVEQIEEMDKSQTPPGRDGGYQFAPGPKVSKKDIEAIKKNPAKHLSDLFAKEYSKKKVKEEVEQIEEGIEDRIEAARAKAKAAGKTIKDKAPAPKSNVRKVEGHAYGGAKQKDEPEEDEDDTPAKKTVKYGARQNFVRSKRVNESFTEMLSAYKEEGLKFVADTLVVEEPTEEEFNAEIKKAQDKSEGKDKAEVAKASVQAVKNEEVEVIDADQINGVEEITIDERHMTDSEMNKREKIVKSMKKGLSGFKQRYGDRAKNVMYATATKQAMKD